MVSLSLLSGLSSCLNSLLMESYSFFLRPIPKVSHILPGLDDGSKSLEESVAMLRQAAAAGTTDIVASPHANQDYDFDPLVVERKIGELQAAAGESPLIHYGCDFHLTLENIDDALRFPGKYSDLTSIRWWWSGKSANYRRRPASLR